MRATVDTRENQVQAGRVRRRPTGLLMRQFQPRPLIQPCALITDYTCACPNQQ